MLVAVCLAHSVNIYRATLGGFCGCERTPGTVRIMKSTNRYKRSLDDRGLVIFNSLEYIEENSLWRNKDCIYVSFRQCARNPLFLSKDGIDARS